MAGVLPWSWSTLELYETCPKRFYELKIAKSCKEPESQHLIWGNEVHTAFELLIKHNEPLPQRMSQWNNIAAKLQAAPGDKYPELALGIDKNLIACDFWDKEGWNRGKEDLVIINGNVAVDLDYKTGKEKQYSKQLDISAARIFANFVDVDIVHTSFVWLETGRFTRATFVRENYYAICESFNDRVAQMLWSEKHNTWPAKPSGLCKRGRKPGSTYMGCPVTNCPHSENFRK